jgi:hypothetical protein
VERTDPENGEKGRSRSMDSSTDSQTAEVAIEYGVPIPNPAVQGRWIDLFQKVNAGASFLATEKDAMSFQKMARKKGCAVVVRRTHEQPDRPCRVWVVEKKEVAHEPVR